MTAQIGEKLFYKGEKTRMASEPLNQYLEKANVYFVWTNTGCWRGYQGSWEIKDNKLFLIDFEATIEDVDGKWEDVGLDYLFPNQKEVFAKWFTGKIVVDVGDMLMYIHMGYESVYEKTAILEFKNGILISEKEFDNRNKFMKLSR